MRRHVEQLTAAFAQDDVAIYTVKRLDRAKVLTHPETGELLELQLPAVRSAVSYATALHEIGHVKGRHQKSRSVMVRERWAWRWAKENALIWTSAMDRSATKALAWYEARQLQSRRCLKHQKITAPRGGKWQTTQVIRPITHLDLAIGGVAADAVAVTMLRQPSLVGAPDTSC